MVNIFVVLILLILSGLLISPCLVAPALVSPSFAISNAQGFLSFPSTYFFVGNSAVAHS